MCGYTSTRNLSVSSAVRHPSREQTENAVPKAVCKSHSGCGNFTESNSTLAVIVGNLKQGQRKDCAADCSDDPVVAAAAAVGEARAPCEGTSLLIKSPAARISSGVKSKSGGRGRSRESLVIGFRSSSKNACAHDCIGVIRRSGV